MRIYLRRLVLIAASLALVALFIIAFITAPGIPSTSKRQTQDEFGKTLDDLMEILDNHRSSIDHLIQQVNWTTSTTRSTTITTPAASLTNETELPARQEQPFIPLHDLSDAGHDNTISHVWPVAGETEDRVLSQMSANKSSGKTKTILLFSGVRREDAGNKRLLAHQCPVTDCRLTGDTEEAASADAILFEGSIAEPTRLLHKARPPGQIWVLFFLESPFHTMGLKEYYGKVNYTATYRRDSTIVTPYERWVQHRNLSSLPSSPSKNYAEGKTKQVAWFVSNCGDKNGRLLYAKELQKYIGVDIYGQCGDKQCPRGEPRCTNMLRNDYKFYLAFENSNCQDYITEKLYWNAYQNDIIPIVMGARSEDYRKTAPPGSYIHVDSFASPRALADYLSLLDKDDSLYNQYFRWKNTGEFIDTKWWCRLCAMVHQPFIDHHQQTVTDLDSWWRGPGVCVAPRKGQRWATWRK